MANIKSSIKRAKTNSKRNALKAPQRTAMRTAIKNVEKAVLAADVTTAQEALVVATKKIDRAAGKGLIHKNKAANLKSRLTKSVRTLEA